MAHPFEKILYKALKASTPGENLVLKEAKRIREKGYPEAEIAGILEKLKKSLIEDTDVQIVGEALEDFLDSPR